MYRCPECKALSIPSINAMTPWFDVDCKDCGAKLKRKRTTLKESWLVLGPLVMSLSAIGAIKLLVDPSLPVPVNYYITFFLAIGGFVSFYMAFSVTEFEKI